MTGLPKDSVAVLAQLVAVDRSLLTEQVGRISKQKIKLLLAGIDVVLGR
jgi:hypothetical protein